MAPCAGFHRHKMKAFIHMRLSWRFSQGGSGTGVATCVAAQKLGRIGARAVLAYSKQELSLSADASRDECSDSV